MSNKEKYKRFTEYLNKNYPDIKFTSIFKTPVEDGDYFLLVEEARKKYGSLLRTTRKGKLLYDFTPDKV